MIASRLVVITGLSGSGKSTALKALEDLGFHCVDNLPAALISPFLEFIQKEPEAVAAASSEFTKPYALLLECRDREVFSEVLAALKQATESGGIPTSQLFLDCQDDILIRRFRETRRPHPLLNYYDDLNTVAEAIERDREVVSEARESADTVIDSSMLSPHELRSSIEQFVGAENELKIFITSFGYKYGTPHDADLLVDVRFLPNPHFDRELKEFTGLEDKVKKYVFSSGEADEFISKYTGLLDYLIPRYVQEGKSYLTLGIGCTGGKHRSVAISEAIASYLENEQNTVHISHRDIKK